MSHRSVRHLVSALGTAAALLAACGTSSPPASTPTASAADAPVVDVSLPAPASSATTPPAPTADLAAIATAPAPTLDTAAPATKEGVMGTATIRGIVNFTGKAPVMKVPRKRKEAEFCKGKPVKHDAILVNKGKLAQALVHLTNDSVKGDYKPPAAHVTIEQIDCMYVPRIQGAVVDQVLDVKNNDPTLHNVHAYKNNETWFNRAQPKGSIAITQELENTGIVKLLSDVRPWMRSFLLVSSHPFFAVSGADGSFTIDKVPAGKFTIEAWHPRYGAKRGNLEVVEGKSVEVSFTYDGTEAEPDENKDELTDLF